MLVINTNVSNLILQRHFGKTNVALQTSLERLSSGFKINHAADDAANMALSEHMQTQVLGSSVAIDNAQHGLNFIDTAESTLANLGEIAQRIRELSIQAMNGTYSNMERAMMQNEVDELTKELYRQRNATKFNNVNVFGEKEEYPVDIINAEIKSDDDTSKTPLLKTAPVLKAGTSGVLEAAAIKKITEEEAIALGYNIIKTAEDFKNMDISEKNILMANINFDDITGWTQKNLTGELNGNGYSVNNYSNTKAMFATISGTVQNITLKDVDVNATTSTGALANTLSGKISDCTVTGSVTGTSAVGGLVGNATGSANITNCSMSGNINGTGNYVGGLVGNSQAVITNSSASGNVITKGSYAGGLVGASGGAITNCSTNGTVIGEGNYVGGLVGNSLATITKSSSKGKVEGKGSYTGGLVGNSTNAISNSNSSSTVNGSKSYVGGFAGASSGTISGCSSTGSVNGLATNTGGLVGYNTSTITSSKASGKVYGKGDNTGGLIGNNTNGTVTSCTASGIVESAGAYGGGLIGYCSNGKISLSSATGNVISDGTSCYGGLIGHLFNNSVVSECYATGNVKGNSSGQFGGLVGHIFSNSTIRDSYSTGDVIGNDVIGGSIGLAADATIENCYTTGNVFSNNIYAGGFVGKYNNNVYISNSYSQGFVTSRNGGAFSSGAGSSNFVNCHANAQQPAGVTISQMGVADEIKIWFDDNNNLGFLGSKYDLTSEVTPPQLTANPRYVPPKPIPPEPEKMNLELQVGANSDENNVLLVGSEFYLRNYYGNVSTVDNAKNTLNKTDELIQRITSHRALDGATTNRLACVIDSLEVQLTNTTASRSRILDTDFAKETSNFVRNKILQQSAAALFSQTHTSGQVAMMLLG